MIFKVLFGFLCRHVVGCLLDIHTRVDTFAVYNGMIRGYTENLVIKLTLVIKCIHTYLPRQSIGACA